MTAATVLPHVNAVLNTLSTILLLIGFAFIRSGNREIHRTFMIAAIIVSAIFLASYLTYHFMAPIFVFPGTGWTVPAYYTLLITHVILATVVTPMVMVTAWRALKGNFERHKLIARWTLPIWLYVTVTGVAIYVILYHVYPPPSA
jgi:putative membrane protein